MRTILVLMAIVGFIFGGSGCVEVTTVPTQIAADDNVEEVQINSDERIDTGGM